MLKIYILISGKYGSRIVNNLAQMGLASNIVGIHEVPDDLPEFIDNVDKYIPQNLPEANLIISIGLRGDINMIIPEIALKTGAKSIIVPIYDPAQIPPGLQSEIKSELEDTTIVFPKPFCTLETVGDKYIDEFAQKFGKPKLEIEADTLINSVKVIRGAPCGSTNFVAEKIINLPVGEAEIESGRRYHNYPCLASMSTDTNIGDTLMHIAGYKIKEAVKNELGVAFNAAVVDEDKCEGGTNCDYNCIKQCPTIKVGDTTIKVTDNGKVNINPLFCGYCGICEQKCPSGAIKLKENLKIKRD